MFITLPASPRPTVLIARVDARADLSAVATMPRGAARRRAAYDALVANARATQGAALAALTPLHGRGLVTGVRSLHLPNALLITAAPGGEQAVRDALAGVARIGEVRRSERFTVDGNAGVVEQHAPKPATSWALEAVGAADAHTQGATGRGVTIGFIDSGVDAQHEAIAPNYRGTRTDGRQSHDHNWFDPIGRSATPVDPRGHGTHVVSAAVSPGLGVAPDARVIVARATDKGYNETAATLEALQWMLAPTAVDGSDPRPDLGADVLNNSWGTSNGADDFFRESYDALRAAGVEIVTATGNSGPERGTVSAPASYPGSISVGATDRRGELAEFSSRGPSPIADAELAPMLIAPGTVVPTATAGGGYAYSSGTSIAAPIVAGALAALLSVRPDATHSQLVDALTATALDVAPPGPDDDSGFGRLNLAAAVPRLLAAR